MTTEQPKTGNLKVIIIAASVCLTIIFLGTLAMFLGFEIIRAKSDLGSESPLIGLIPIFGAFFGGLIAAIVAGAIAVMKLLKEVRQNSAKMVTIEHQTNGNLHRRDQTIEAKDNEIAKLNREKASLLQKLHPEDFTD